MFSNQKFINRNTNILAEPEIDRDMDFDGLITNEEVQKMINKSKGNKAPGVDGVQNSIWKELSKNDQWLDVFVKIFNKIFGSNKIPDTWKKAEVVPIYKNKGRMDDPRNFRCTGISLLPAIYGTRA